jgi:transmembrane sensor
MVLVQRPVVERHSTGVGGFERVLLADGSAVELNTETAIDVHFEKRARHVSLLRGEASFHVARDHSRPFIVVAGDVAVRAVGTQFDVRRRDEAVEVLVTEGKVAVGRPSTLGGAIHTIIDLPVVAAGQSAVVSHGGVHVRELRAPDAARELAWQSGMLIFDGEPLRDVIAEFNRYSADRHLIVTDPALSALRIGGYFKATNIDEFVATLERSFGVKVEAAGDEIRLEPAGATNNPEADSGSASVKRRLN